MALACAANSSPIRSRLPQRAGDRSPAAGGTYLPMVRKSWPMNPSGVQLARPIFPPGAQTRTSSAAACSWFGVNMTPKVDSDGVEGAVREGQGLGVGLAEGDVEAVGTGPLARAREERGNVVGRGDLAPSAGGRERCVAVAGGDVEHLLACAEVEGLAELLPDDLQGGADDRVVSGRPGRPLAVLDLAEVGDGGGWRLNRRGEGLIHGFTSTRSLGRRRGGQRGSRRGNARGIGCPAPPGRGLPAAHPDARLAGAPEGRRRPAPARVAEGEGPPRLPGPGAARDPRSQLCELLWDVPNDPSRRAALVPEQDPAPRRRRRIGSASWPGRTRCSWTSRGASSTPSRSSAP